MQINYLIFDFDGVLARTLDDNIDLHLKLDTYRTTDRTQIKNKIQDHFSKPRHATSNALSKDEQKQQHDRLNSYIEPILSINNTVFREFLKHVINLKNCKLGIISTGSQKVIRTLLGEMSTNFNPILTFEDSLSKEDKLKTLCDDWKVEPNQCYYITDTISDVLELETQIPKNQIIGCSWGWSGYEGLRTVLPSNQIFKQFDDILTFQF
jgi:HAD superfamily hydrolase (TIGR01549 family)